MGGQCNEWNIDNPLTIQSTVENGSEGPWENKDPDPSDGKEYGLRRKELPDSPGIRFRLSQDQPCTPAVHPQKEPAIGVIEVE